MARLLQIAEIGNDILRKRAEEVDAVPHELIEDMMLSMEEAGGVGIAAPQIYESKRVFIMASQPNDRYPDAPEMEPKAIMNPEILSHSDETEKGWEGCLSVPGVRGYVPRYLKVSVRYMDKEGATLEEEFEGFLARIFQHELDHLDGLVFLDRVEDNKDIISNKEYFKMMAEKSSK